MQKDNTKERLVSISQFLKAHVASETFKKGYNDALKNIDYDYNVKDKASAIRYARGRAFAIYCKSTKQPRAVWRKGILAKTAQERFIYAVRTGWIL